MRRSFHLSVPMVLLACALLAWPSRAAAQTSIARGQRWSQTVTSTVSYANAWLSTRLCVQYTAPSGKLYTGLGYWDQPLSPTSDQFQIRAAFNETGSWSWTLIDATGCAPSSSFTVPSNRTINVGLDATGLALYQLGPLRLSSSLGLANRFLVYSGAGTLTPFVWIGDTSWSGPYLSFLSSWQNYTANRQSKGFTVIQTAAPLAPTTDVTGRPAFVSTAGGSAACPAGTVLPSSACWPNKAYWDYWDSHVNDVNAKGMLAVVVGLFKRVDGSTNWPAVADSQGYARWIAARLAGNYTALSPGFDELPGRSKTFTEPGCGGVSGTAVNQACRARQVGTAIRDAILLNTTINASPRAGDPLTAAGDPPHGGRLQRRPRRHAAEPVPRRLLAGPVPERIVAGLPTFPERPGGQLRGAQNPGGLPDRARPPAPPHPLRRGSHQAADQRRGHLRSVQQPERSLLGRPRPADRLLFVALRRPGLHSRHRRHLGLEWLLYGALGQRQPRRSLLDADRGHRTALRTVPLESAGARLPALDQHLQPYQKLGPGDPGAGTAARVRAGQQRTFRRRLPAG